MFTLNYNTHVINYDIVKRKKKSISIKITPELRVLVVAPLFVSEKEIEKVVQDKAEWIWEKLAVVKERTKSRVVHKFVSGEKFLYMGDECELAIVTDDKIKRARVSLHIDRLEVRIPASEEYNSDIVRNSLLRWYRKEAEEKLAESVEFYSEKMGLCPRVMRVKELKSSWGLCSGRGDISLCFRLVMAPIEVMDYVVVHELSHLRHHNHSKEFWNLVLIFAPDYKEKRKWLRFNGISLIVE